MMDTSMELKSKKSYQVETKMAPKNSRSAWSIYLMSMRGFLAWTERQYERLGRGVTTHPIITILVALLGVSFCAAGLVRYNFEYRSTKLYIPQNSPSIEALEDGNPYFQSAFNTRVEEVIFTPKKGVNALSKEVLEDALVVTQNVHKITGYEILCKSVMDFAIKANTFQSNHNCSQINIFDILGNTTHPKELVYEKLTAAKVNVSLLMSNGRSFEVNANEMLSEFRLTAASKLASAKALRIQFFMQQGQINGHGEKVLNWEKSFISKMKVLQGQLNNTNLYFTAERAMDDSIGESTSSDHSLVSITFTVMITFACLMLSKFVNPVRGHNWLAMSGVVSTGLGILAGIGAAVAFGVPFISLVGVVPFLVVSIGIDDMFILVDEYDRQSDEMAPRDRVKFTLSKVGATITMTTLTDVVAFFISTTTSFPAIRYFCIYVALCISIEFLLQVTLFIAFLTFDSIRIYQSRSDCFPMKRVRDRNSCQVSSKSSLADRAMRQYGKILLKLPVKICVVLLSLCMIGGGIAGCFYISNEFNRKSLALPDSFFIKYVETFEQNFPQTIPVNIQITKPIDYSDPSIRKEFAKSVDIAYETGYYLSRNISWIASFEDYVTRLNIAANGSNFKSALASFLSVPQYGQHKLDVITDKSNNIIASRIVIFYKDNPNSEFQKNAMIKLREALKSKLNLPVTVAANFFIYFEQYAIVTEEIIRNLISVSAVILIIMLPFCIHPFIVLILLFCFAALIVELFGMMYLWNVQLNSISMITLVMAIGFTADYSSHIAHAFVISRKRTANERIIHALESVGASVLLGGTSTFLGMSLTGFAKSTIFQIFFKMFVGIILFGLYNGLVLLPVLLSVFSSWIETALNKKQLSNEPSDETPSTVTKKFDSGDTKGSISILGMSTRFPKARNKEQFWELLKSGINTVEEYPENRETRTRLFKWLFNPSKGVPGRHYVMHGSYLEGIDGFDCKFFGISKAEATSMDPQQRMLLQGTYEAIEDAGMTVEELQQCRTGVYTGVMNLDFSSVTFSPYTMKNFDQFSATGTSMSITANRISFAFNMTGPSIAFDTACSSSLTALLVACDHLEKGEIDVAVVATANILLDPLKHASICKASMLSPDGKCKTFDESADGYGRGEGVAVMILKATDYVVNREETYGEILSWGANNDGQTAAPMTAPSVIGQKMLMGEVLQGSGIDPRDVQYVEMHGTGTYIGDLVETRSIGEVYGISRDPSDPVIIGSVKSNISHTESTAGLAGLAKVCLMIEHQEYVPTVGVKNQAVRLALEDKRLLVCSKNSPWPEKYCGFPRIAGVNSFGFGGSNAHVIIREKVRSPRPENRRIQEENACKMLVFSTKSTQTLARMAERVSTWLKSMDDNTENQTNVCYTMSQRRTRHNYRLVVDASSLQQASSVLNKFVANPDLKSVDICSSKTSQYASKVAFVFGGQGSQWLGMAGDILQNNEIAATLHQIDHIRKEAGIEPSILAFLGNEADQSLSDNLVACQLAIFALQYAVAQFLIKKAGIQPLAVTGHSLGDITAACVANIITLSQAIKIISIRAKVQDQCQQNGAMAAVALPVDEIKTIIGSLSIEKLSIAAENDKMSVTVSGDEEDIDKLAEYLKRERKTVFVRKLDTKKAFHSQHMDAIQPRFMKKLGKAKITPKGGNMRFFSTTEGKEVIGTVLNDNFWWQNLRNPVLFNASIEAMMASGIRVFVEISPRPVVSYYIKEIAKQTGIKDTSVIQALPKKDVTERLKHLHIQCVGKIYSLGYAIRFDSLQDYTSAKFIRYPSYPWDEQQLWPKDEYFLPSTTMVLLGAPVELNSDKCVWENDLDLLGFSFLKDHGHQTLGVLFPGACYIELAFEAAVMNNKIQPLTLRNLVYKNILPLDDNSLRTIRCTREASSDSMRDLFTVTHVTDQGEVILSTADIIIQDRQHSDEVMPFSEAFNPPAKASVNNNVEQDIQIQSANDENREASKDVVTKSPNVPIESVMSNSSLTTESTHVDDNFILQMAGLSTHDKVDGKKLEVYEKSVGFLYGERFSMTEESWADTEISVIRLRFSDELQDETANYVLHPCLIDACTKAILSLELQKKELTGSSESSGRSLPIGADEIKLYPLRKKFTRVYCTAMLCANIEKAYDLAMMDEKGNMIMKFNRFRVTDIETERRDPLLEKSIYKLCWSEAEEIPEGNADTTASYVFISSEELDLTSMAVSALQQLGVADKNIATINLQESNDKSLFEEHLLPLFKRVYEANRKLYVVNMLPASAQSLPLEASSSAKAEWLCFESTLEIIKLLSKLEMTDIDVIAISFNGNGMKPWGGISNGMAVSADLEASQGIISAEMTSDASPNDFKKLFAAVNNGEIESRILVSKNRVFNTVIDRYDSKVEKSQELLEEHDKFYLSWSPSQNAFELKRLHNDCSALLPGHVEIRVSHISSVFGQAEILLKEIKQYDSNESFQCVVGSVSMIDGGAPKFTVGEEVVALVNSKWIKNTLRLPIEQVFKKPPFLSKTQAAVFPAAFAYANKIVGGLTKFSSCLETMHVAASENDRGICWVIAKAAEKQGMDVTMNDALKPDAIKNIAHKIDSNSCLIDCLVCSSDLHPADVDVLLQKITKDGIVVLVDTTAKGHSLNLQRAAAVINVSPLCDVIPEDLMGFVEKEISCLEFILNKETPRILSRNLNNFCSTGGKNANTLSKAFFDCWQLEADGTDRWYVTRPSLDHQGLKEDHTYIVVGGARGIGLKTVEWMVRRGARTILVVGVSQLSPSTKLVFDELKKQFNARILHERVSIASEDAIRVLNEKLDSLPPVAGVVNSAGIIDDRELTSIDQESYQRVMRPKIEGTLNLHELLESRNQNVDFFIVYSSIASIMGNNGQASYSAANGFLNSFADYRVNVLGKPCLSVCWGPMGGTGMLDRNKKLAHVLEKVGFFQLDVDKGIMWMENNLLTHPNETCISICDIGWNLFFKGERSRITRILFERIIKEFNDTDTSDDEKLLSKFMKANSKEEQEEILLQFIRRVLVTFTGGTEEEIDSNVSLYNYGVDSVGAAYLRSGIFNELDVDIEVFYFMLPETTSISLARTLLDKLNEKQAAKEQEKKMASKNQDSSAEGRRHSSSGRRVHSFRTVSPNTTNKEELELPDDYLTAIYDPPDAIAKIFIVHPSHRYAGVFQPMANGFKHQELFSLYAFGYQDPSHIGDDIKSVKCLADACLKLMLKKQAHGPYFLAGYSFGGIIALEMATILKNMGETVALVTMIDTGTWHPDAAYNARAIKEVIADPSLQEALKGQIWGFFARIATTQLSMSQKDYDDEASSRSIEDMADFLNKRAADLDREISNTRKLLDSTLGDYEMSGRCSNEWFPPANMYNGPLLYIEADTCLCQRQQGYGKCRCKYQGAAFDRWSLLFNGDAIKVKCPGDHFLMMERSRGPQVGNVLAVVASLTFRNMSTLTAGIKLNANHSLIMDICKNRGINVCMFRKSALGASVVRGCFKVSDTNDKIVFHGEGIFSSKMQINLRDVVSIRKMDKTSLRKAFKSTNFSGMNVQSGLCFQELKRKTTFMCFKKKDFKHLTYLIEGIYHISFPF